MISSQIRRTGVVLLTIAAIVGTDRPESVVEKVREGIRLFRASEFETSKQRFSEAVELDPENAVAVFDEACAAAAAGQTDTARDLFQKTSLSSDRDLAVRSHYNLGCLEADAARSTLGEDPAAVTGDTRQQVIELLLVSVRHYRDVLRHAPNHADARHNLELIRLYIKHIQSLWEERDRQQARDEKNLLQFLRMIEDHQDALRSATRPLIEESDSALRRQTVRDLADQQRDILQEIEPLKLKITDQFQQQSQTAMNGPPNQQLAEQAKQAEELLLELAGESGRQMTVAADQLDENDASAAVESQTQSLEQLNQLYMAIAPYTDILQRSIQQQTRLAELPKPDSSLPDSSLQDSTSQDSPSQTTASETAPSDGQTQASDKKNGEAASAEAQTQLQAARKPDTETSESTEQLPTDTRHAPVDFELSREQQAQIMDWSRMLLLKAQNELPQREQQLQALKQSVPAGPNTADLSGTDDATEESGADETASSPTDSTKDGTESQDANTTQNAGSSHGNNAEQMQEQLKQLEGLVASMTKAVELAPSAEEHSVLATEALSERNQDAAVSEQQETLRILNEIAEPLAKQPDQDQQQENRNDNNDQKNDDQERNNDNSQQDDQQQQQQKQDDRQQQQDQQREEQEQQSKQERAQSVLNQARERERRHREMEKQIQQILGQRIKVERDW